MKKSFIRYALIWAIALAVFNLVVFLVRPIIPGYVISYDGRFWIAWAFIIAAFMGNLICAAITFAEENTKKQFYKLPLVTVTYTGMILMTVGGVVLMLIPSCPAWVAAIACIILFALNLVAVLKAAWAGKAVADVDEKVKANTQFIRTATVQAQAIMNHAQGDEIKEKCRKVYEAIRYSDPMSSKEVEQDDKRIAAKLEELSEAAAHNDAEQVTGLADEITLLVAERNGKVKAAK